MVSFSGKAFSFSGNGRKSPELLKILPEKLPEKLNSQFTLAFPRPLIIGGGGKSWLPTENDF